MRLMTVVNNSCRPHAMKSSMWLSNSQPTRALTAFSASLLGCVVGAAGDGVGRLLALRHTISHERGKIGSKIRKSGNRHARVRANRLLVIRLVPEHSSEWRPSERCPRACRRAPASAANVILHVENARRLAGTFEVLAELQKLIRLAVHIVLSVMPWNS